MTSTEDRDRAVAATEAAAEAVRALNHAAYQGEITTDAVYSRAGSLFGLLSSAEQAVRVLGEHVAQAGALPGLFSDDSTAPEAHTTAAAAYRLEAAAAVGSATTAVNEAW